MTHTNHPEGSSETNYNYLSHTHCWAQYKKHGSSACGIPLEKHTQCCLCDLPVPGEKSVTEQLIEHYDKDHTAHDGEKPNVSYEDRLTPPLSESEIKLAKRMVEILHAPTESISEKPAGCCEKCWKTDILGLATATYCHDKSCECHSKKPQGVNNSTPEWESRFWELTEEWGGGAHINYATHVRDLFRETLTSERTKIREMIEGEIKDVAFPKGRNHWKCEDGFFCRECLIAVVQDRVNKKLTDILTALQAGDNDKTI